MQCSSDHELKGTEVTVNIFNYVMWSSFEKALIHFAGLVISDNKIARVETSVSRAVVSRVETSASRAVVSRVETSVSRAVVSRVEIRVSRAVVSRIQFKGDVLLSFLGKHQRICLSTSDLSCSVGLGASVNQKTRGQLTI